MANRTTTRLSADERREQVLEAATSEFAVGGLHGTSADDIARRAGISQPYLFRLFGSKKELFLLTVDAGFDRVERLFKDAAAAGPPESALDRMGDAYVLMLADRQELRCQMQAYAACGDPDVQELCRRRFGELYRLVETLGGVDSQRVRQFMANGMLLNVAAAIDLPEIAVSSEWARRALGVDHEATG